MIATLNWTPGGGSNSINQSVQYRLKGDSVWITFSTVSPTINTETVTGLSDDEIYEFQIVDNCTVGGPVPSSTIEKIKITCPAVTYSSTYNTIGFSFPELGGDIVDYLLELWNSDVSAVIASQTKPTAATVSGSFTGLTASTTYNIRVIPRTAGATYSKDCGVTPVTTAAAPVCNPPTGVTATIS
jgi:hypothetical protein